MFPGLSQDPSYLWRAWEASPLRHSRKVTACSLQHRLHGAEAALPGGAHQGPARSGTGCGTAHGTRGCVPHMVPVAILQMVQAVVPHRVPAVVPHVVPAVVPHRVPAAVPHMVPAVVPQMVPRSSAGTICGTGCGTSLS